MYRRLKPWLKNLLSMIAWNISMYGPQIVAPDLAVSLCEIIGAGNTTAPPLN